MGYIYLITNTINQKKYIGQTVNSINTRWVQHKSEAKRLQPDVYFIRALRKYGVENFTVEQLEECDDSLLNEREQYYIKLYKSYDHNYGYNSTMGGNSNNRKFDHSLAIKYWNDGLTVQEIAQTLSCTVATISMILKNNNISEQNIRSRSMLKAGEKKKKPILQYDLTGVLLHRFSCIQNVLSSTPFSETQIRGACNNQTHIAYGYIWVHEEDNINIQEIIENIPIAKTKKSIEQYDLNGKLIKTYNSIIEAANEINMHRATIEAALKNEIYQCGKFLWRYVDDSETIEQKIYRYQHRKDYHKKQINQYDLNDNFIMQYDSAADAAKALGKSQGSSSITKACRGKLKTAYGYKWKYVENID